MKKTLARACVLGTTTAVMSLTVTAPAATASPARVTTQVSTATIGDGVWSPSHDESIALIPVCQGPLATLKWLGENFGDHGTDIGRFLAMNWTRLVAIATFSVDPYIALQYVLQPFLQLPVYAVNDTLFHIPPTLGDILTFCGSAR